MRTHLEVEEVHKGREVQEEARHEAAAGVEARLERTRLIWVSPVNDASVAMAESSSTEFSLKPGRIHRPVERAPPSV